MTELGQNSGVKIFWTPEEVYEHLKSLPKGQKLEIKIPNIYCTENFMWNELLETGKRQISLPSLEILRNLKSIAEILQVYRDILGKLIIINSGWRTPAEQQELIRKWEEYEYRKKHNLLNKNEKPVNKPSETSLHIEGLALDVTVKGMPQSVFQSLVNDTLIGEAELTDPTYTHIGLPHYSKGYLKRNNIYSDYIYRNPYIDVSKLSSVESDKIIKRMEPKYWKKVPSTFNSGKNQKLFSGKLSTDIYINPEQSESVNNTNTPVNKNNFTNNHSISGDTATGQSHSGMIIQEFPNSGKNVGTYRDSMNITNDNSENFNPYFTNYDKNIRKIF